MAGNAFDNLNKIFLSDTFRAWFDKTNQIINTMNPLEIYGVTAGRGEVAGLTMDFGADGIVTIGLELPDALTGDFTFNSGVTFANYVNVTGLTVDFSANGGHGATLTGRVVRTINGATGDVALDFVAIPGNSADGDILYYENTPVGATFRTYNLFSDGTADNGMFHIGGSGGVFFGITAGGASSANEFVKLGNIQLVGSTASGIYMVDNSQAALSTAKIAGADIRYGTDAGSQLLSIGGRNISGVEHSTKNLILDFNRQSIAVGGAATGDASLNIGDVSNAGRPILYTDAGGSTFAVRYLLAGEAGGRTSGGSAGITSFGGNPSTKGLQDVDKRIRLENVSGSVEVELVGSGVTSAFAVYGKHAPYGDLLTPALVARRDGNVVIGGIAPTDGGITGTTYGGLNIASGKLYVGGSAGAVITSGYQFLHSSGTEASWKKLEQTSFSFNGDIGSVASGSISENTTTGVFVSMNTVSTQPVAIKFRDSSGTEMTGPFSATISFPGVKPNGSLGSGNKGVLGIRMTLDGVIEDKFITWDDLMYNSVGPAGNNPALNNVYNPSFTFTGNAKTGVSFTPFMTKGSAFTTNQTFTFVHRGTYLVEFHKLG